MQKIEYNIFEYGETNNPYSNEENITVDFITNDKNEQYFCFFINNADNDGVGIFLTIDQTRELINNLQQKIDETFTE